MHSYDNTHWKAAVHLLIYLLRTQNKALTYTRTKKEYKCNPIECYVDSDYAEDKNGGRHSYSGCAVFLFGNLIQARTKRQKLPAVSSTEAEFYSLGDGLKEFLYVHNLLSEFMIIASLSKIYLDNKGAQYLAQNYVNNNRTKHLDVRYHFIRHYVHQKLIQLCHIPSKQNLADLFTKGLGRIVFQRFVSMILQIMQG